MGVPAFFRWLGTKYPSIVTHCSEKHGAILDNKGTRGPVDTTEANPNGQEFDNFYLDMNGIIHPCTHPENKTAPKNEAEMFVAIFEYMDRLFDIIRPRRLMYMAIDGVAPRAKMNQQRSRRFRAAQESKEKIMTVEKLRNELLARGAYFPNSNKEKSEHFDSNCITPGTPFMSRLAVALRYYIYDRLTNHPGWKNLLVFLSDANAPGEGEHKIMDFIRRQRSSPTHDPNTRHCLCGADADLIMLGLATHEPHFTIIREEFVPNQAKPCDLCGQLGHEMKDCVGSPKEEEGLESSPAVVGAEAEFIFIHLNVLRQYLAQDLKMTGLPFEWDLERVIDDWVFMCFFVGNDFLPHLPSLEIREGAIDRLIELYKGTVNTTGGWLTDSGRVNMERVDLIMQELGKMEDEIFKTRRQSELNYRERRGRGGGQRGGFGGQRGASSMQPWNSPNSGFLQPVPLGGRPGVAHPQGRYRGSPVSAEQMHQSRRSHHSQPTNVQWVDQNLNNLEVATSMRLMLHKRTSGGLEQNGADTEPSPPKKFRWEEEDDSPSAVSKKQGRIGGVGAAAFMEQQKSAKKAGQSQDNDDELVDANDEVRLWEDGWRARYYQSKFGVDPEDAPEFCKQVAREYARGLCWVLAYYYQGCASWDWYFPYHYAPFASDFCGINDLDPGFDRLETKPFRPLEQLMGVFPADSRSHVPPAWADLMTDPDSPIIDFYPTGFKIDLNGKRYLWMGVALLPFVDEVRLLRALDERRHLLTEEEVARNITGGDVLFCGEDSPLRQLLQTLYEVTPGSMDQDEDEEAVAAVAQSIVPSTVSVIDPKLTAGVSGRIWRDTLDGEGQVKPSGVAYLPGQRVPTAVPDLLPDIPGVKAISVCFANPAYPKGFIFPARLLDSVDLPPPAHLQPPQRGRGRGGAGAFGSPGGGRADRGRFTGQAAMQYYARGGDEDKTNYASTSHSPMQRMVHHGLPPSRGNAGSPRGHYSARGWENSGHRGGSWQQRPSCGPRAPPPYRPMGAGGAAPPYRPVGAGGPAPPYRPVGAGGPAPPYRPMGSGGAAPPFRPPRGVSPGRFQLDVRPNRPPSWQPPHPAHRGFGYSGRGGGGGGYPRR